MGKSLEAQLLEFDRARLRREECLVSWKAIAYELGVSEDTLQRWFEQRDRRLPRWGPKPNSPVFLPLSKIAILKALYFESAG